MKKYIILLSIIISCTEPVEKNSNEYKIQAQVWTQNAAEYRALCYQAYNVAKMNLDQFLDFEKKYEKPLAIIADVDETVLDNSPYDGKLILDNN